MAASYKTDTKLQAKHQKILSELLHLPGNETCADCGARHPRYASITLGTFICNRCYSVHRKVGAHITRGKVVGLDAWSVEEIAKMKEVGNAKAKQYWEARLPSTYKSPGPDSPDRLVESWIRDKYEARLYCPRDQAPPGVATANTAKVSPRSSISTPTIRRPSEQDDADSFDPRGGSSGGSQHPPTTPITPTKVAAPAAPPALGPLPFLPPPPAPKAHAQVIAPPIPSQTPPPPVSAAPSFDLLGSPPKPTPEASLATDMRNLDLGPTAVPEQEAESEEADEFGDFVTPESSGGEFTAGVQVASSQDPFAVMGDSMPAPQQQTTQVSGLDSVLGGLEAPPLQTSTPAEPPSQTKSASGGRLSANGIDMTSPEAASLFQSEMPPQAAPAMASFSPGVPPGAWRPPVHAPGALPQYLGGVMAPPGGTPAFMGVPGVAVPPRMGVATAAVPQNWGGVGSAFAQQATPVAPAFAPTPVAPVFASQTNIAAPSLGRHITPISPSFAQQTPPVRVAGESTTPKHGTPRHSTGDAPNRQHAMTAVGVVKIVEGKDDPFADLFGAVGGMQKSAGK